MADEVARVAAIDDRAERLREATRGVSEAQRTMTELSRLRRALVQELHDEGWTFAEIADAAGLSRGRVHQVRHQGPRPEGAFFGAGPFRIVTPLKREDQWARPVVAAEDVAASQRLGELLRSLGFEYEFEQMPLSGELDLNRDGLIIFSGPRTSDAIGALLEADQAIRFKYLKSGWALRDLTTSTTYKSGHDESEPFDIAYLGRLPRPDGNGNVIILTGIHPPGTLGLTQFLCEHLTDLHRDSRKGPMSVLLRVDYDAESHEPTAVRTITPVHRHGN